jgi:hypothetical protein
MEGAGNNAIPIIIPTNIIFSSSNFQILYCMAGTQQSQEMA